ncbi:cell division cycle 7-related protein kinase [Anopheles maculipalpis]|uniref:cell division cycle 7-related protein kinase n=1 Tax=Anopheles maculipalpis TaxID=1496333 RepID=UPI002158D518|nr:cell division cycle 7-related protein kinase [Anopheles maculipalpis]
MDSTQQQRQSRTAEVDEEEDGRDVKMHLDGNVDLNEKAKKRGSLMDIEQETAVCPRKMEAGVNNNESQNVSGLKIWDRYVVHGLIDKGTFSTVSLATLRKEQHLPFDKRRQFAIKLITQTSHPSRIEREILCMKKIGGQRNVVGLVGGFRLEGEVALVMNYIPQEPFHLYYAQLTAAEVQRFLQQLLIALEWVHLHGVIHRDVKPSNFLHSPRNGGSSYILVDFGLAQETDKGALSLRTPVVPRRPAGQLEDQVVPRHQETVVVRNPLKRPGGTGNTATHPLKLSNSSATKDVGDVPLARQTKSVAAAIGNGLKHRRTAVVAPYTKDLKTGGNGASCKLPTCSCSGRPQVCNECLVQAEMNAPRAGTPGYRPPEVLLKYPNQTTAVDIWAAGVIFLSLLSKCYPFFDNVDDNTSLAHMIEVFGFQRLQETAHALDRRLHGTPETMEKQPYNLRRICQHFRNIHQQRAMGSGGETGGAPAGSSSPPSGRCDEDNFGCDNCCKPLDSCLCQNRRHGADGSDGHSSREAECDEYGPDAYDLLERLLETNPHARISATEALQHPYFQVQY